MNQAKFVRPLFFAGICICLLQIWWPAYFLTGDGPCHVYNAQILHDIWTGTNVPLYSRFFEVIHQPNPNWLSTIVIALLLFVSTGPVAEKLFLTLYLLTFVWGFRLLLRRLAGGQEGYWALVVFCFVFTTALSKGFYNFSFSIAFFFWAVWSWLRFADRRNVPAAAVFITFLGLAFFTHLLAFVFSAFTCGALVVSAALAQAQKSGWRSAIQHMARPFCSLLLAVLPFLLLMRWFTDSQGGMQLQVSHHFLRINDLVIFKFLVSLCDAESVFAAITGIGLLLLLALCLAALIRHRQLHAHHGLLACLGLALFVYFFFPEDFLGRAILISLRLQLYIYIAIACCVASMLPYARVKSIAGVLLFSCFAGRAFVQLRCRIAAGAAEKEIMTCMAQVPPNAVVLPLNLAPNGKDKNGKIIADRSWIFCHTAQYPMPGRPLLVLDNYEANVGYFPLRWKDSVNPYAHLSQGPGIEGLPPGADIPGYEAQTGVRIDYIMIWCFDSSYLANEHFAALYAQIAAGYNPVYQAGNGRCRLFARK